MTTSTRPKIKHALTATAFAWVQVRNVWRAYFKALAAERREVARKQREHGWH